LSYLPLVRIKIGEKTQILELIQIKKVVLEVSMTEINLNLKKLDLSSFMIFLDIFMLIIISVSPLINPDTLKPLLFILLFFLNFKYLFIVKVKDFCILAVLFCLFSLSSLWDLRNINILYDYSLHNFYIPLGLLIGFEYSKKYNIDDFLNVFEKIIFLVSILSLIGYFVVRLQPEIVYYLPSYSYRHTIHKTMFFYNITSLNRNTGIAWEPGMFQILPNIALYYYIKCHKKELNFFVILIYLITIYTTLSTTGFLLLMFNFLYLFYTLLFKYKKIIIKILFFIFIFLLIPLLGTQLEYHLEHKLFGTVSFQKRIIPFVNALEDASNNLLGLGNTGYNIKYKDGSQQGAWDSIGSILQRYGFPMCIFLLFLLFKTTFFSYPLIFIFFFVTFFTETFWFFPLVTPFYFWWPNSKSNDLSDST